MLYKFKSSTTGDLVMLQANGQQILRIIGKDAEQSAAPAGIILPGDMAAAILALTQAVAREEADMQSARDKASADGQSAPRRGGITLRQRAYPFIDMLRTCQTAGQVIVWGV